MHACARVCSLAQEAAQDIQEIPELEAQGEEELARAVAAAPRLAADRRVKPLGELDDDAGACACVCVFACACACRPDADSHERTYTQTHACARVHTHTHTHTHANAHVRTHTHAHALSLSHTHTARGGLRAALPGLGADTDGALGELDLGALTGCLVPAEQLEEEDVLWDPPALLNRLGAELRAEAESFDAAAGGEAAGGVGGASEAPAGA